MVRAGSSQSTFVTVRSEGGLLPPDLLARIAGNDTELKGLTPGDYGLAQGERPNEVTARAWERVKAYWAAFRAGTESLGTGETGITETRELWLLPLFRELGYGRLVYRQTVEEIDGRRYAISHQAGDAAPVHLVSFKQELDRPAGATGGQPRTSPHGLLQEYLNRTEHLWGIVANGKRLRLLRDNQSLSRAAYVEFELEAMLEGGVYADFVLLYLLAHRTRLPAADQSPAAAWLEQWREAAEERGTRALDELRRGVEAAIRALGRGLLEHPENVELRETLVTGKLSILDYYRQLLRLVYRILFLLAAEERELLFEPNVDLPKRDVYRRHYGLSRLRELVEQRRHADRHDDLWRSLRITFAALQDEETAAKLGLKPLGGGLFGTWSCADLDGALIDNARLLEAIRGLAFTRSGTGEVIRRINYRDMDVEELGSVYEGLLELQPILKTTGERPTFDLGMSGERKSTGSYYTNPALVRELIVSALEPVIADALNRGKTAQEKRSNLLDLKVCDPACGSGHFLLAAARRIGREIARIDAGETEPDPSVSRHATRETIAHCVYGVDLNPLAVDLCKLALWLEAHEPGRPLGFIDHHIRHGNSVVGVAAGEMTNGVPDGAFESIIGDDTAHARDIKRRNAIERKGQRGLEDLGWVVSTPDPGAHRLVAAALSADDDSVSAVAAKADTYDRHRRSRDFLRRRLVADLWTAAFFWPLREGEPEPPSQGLWQRLAGAPNLVDYVDARRTGELKGRPELRTVRLARKLAREHAFFHWELEFEDVFAGDQPGFDVVLGNPPWDTLSPDTKEFFAVYDPQVRFQDANGQAKLIARLRESAGIDARWQAYCQALYADVRFYRQSGRYRLFAPGNLGKGDFNIYRMFVETALTVARNDGHVAQLVPEGLYNGANAMAIRKQLFEWTRLDRVIGFENARRYWFPDNHSALKFCFYSARKGGRTECFSVAFNVKTLAQLAEVDGGAVLRMPVDMIQEFSPDALAIMELNSQYEIDIARKMYARWPKFGDEAAGPPHRHYMAEIHMGNDRDLFSDEPTGLPLYEGRMVDQYDHRAKGYRGGRGRSADWEGLPFTSPCKSIQSQWFVPEDRLPRKVRDRVLTYRIGFGDVASPTNERTLIAALIPPGCVCGDKVPTISFGPGQEWACLVWLAVANSFSMDFLARKKVSLKMSYTVLDSLPFPRLELADPVVARIAPLVLALTCTAREMTPFWNIMAVHGWVEPAPTLDPCPGVLDEDARLEVRAELDVFVARDLFGLTRDEMSYVLDTFPIVERHQVKRYGEYRTKRLCLESYD